ncbi:MAG: indole-3-glycerol phosphate synthase TrpC [Peptococcaceae bacterium]|nr:indole-3-glycerol phosphate synthase TrpC [Peptococcaceae bacterium]
MFLENIAASTRQRVEQAKRAVPLAAVRQQALQMSPDTGFPFEKALAAPGLSFICEVKKASPSKGIIAEDFPYRQIAQEYEQAGAAAISVLTEPEYFLGSNDILREIAQSVRLPLLRKDFVVDPYQIYETKLLGASAVLLICALLGDAALQEALALAHALGLSALVETHSAEEVDQAVNAGARIIGVNHRDLRTFTVDLTLSGRLRKRVPSDLLFVAESGIQTAEDVRALRENQTDAALIGESIMRAPDKKRYLAQLRGDSDGQD